MYITVHMIIEAVLALLLLGSLFALGRAVGRIVKKPPENAIGAELFMVVAASGGAEGLERMVRGLLWLNESGEAHGRVVIADCGLEAESRRLAELLAKDSGSVIVCAPHDLPFMLEENIWTPGESE